MEGFSYIAVCQTAEGFGKRSVVPNGIRRGGFAHSRKTVRFKASCRRNVSVYSSVLTSRKPAFDLGCQLRFFL